MSVLDHDRCLFAQAIVVTMACRLLLHRTTWGLACVLLTCFTAFCHGVYVSKSGPHIFPPRVDLLLGACVACKLTESFAIPLRLALLELTVVFKLLLRLPAVLYMLA